MMDARKLFDKIREIKGNALTQAEVDAVNAILAPVIVQPTPVSTDPPPHPKFSTASLKAAILSQAQWKIPASISLAQFAVESGYGEHMPKGSNNPFGIKARVRKGKIIDPYVTATTAEHNFQGEEDWHGPQPFRKFASLDDAFSYHGQLLATGTPYAHARSLLPNVDAFADALTGVYATATNYGGVLKAVMRAQGLYRYNVA